jgi:hypothetical protein
MTMKSKPSREKLSQRLSRQQDFDDQLRLILEGERDALQSFGPIAKGIATRCDWLLNHGRFFTPRGLPADYRHGKAKECYLNSWRMAIEREFVYCEGITMIKLGKTIAWIHHAWCLDSEQG